MYACKHCYIRAHQQAPALDSDAIQSPRPGAHPALPMVHPALHSFVNVSCHLSVVKPPKPAVKAAVLPLVNHNRPRRWAYTLPCTHVKRRPGLASPRPPAAHRDEARQYCTPARPCRPHVHMYCGTQVGGCRGLASCRTLATKLSRIATISGVREHLSATFTSSDGPGQNLRSARARLPLSAHSSLA